MINKIKTLPIMELFQIIKTCIRQPALNSRNVSICAGMWAKERGPYNRAGGRVNLIALFKQLFDTP